MCIRDRIPDSSGEYLTPSFVSVDGDRIYVGKTAKERMIAHPDETASVFKRYMGTDKQFSLGGRLFRPEELSAFLLKKMKEDAEEFLQEEVGEAIKMCIRDRHRVVRADAGGEKGRGAWPDSILAVQHCRRAPDLREDPCRTKTGSVAECKLDDPGRGSDISGAWTV